MSYEVLRYIFIGAAAFSGLMLVVSVLLFIFLKIPSVIGDLTGATAKKAIENIRNQNESSGDKIYKSSAVNRARAKLTDRISESGRLVHNPTDVMGGSMATAKIATQELIEDAKSSVTTVLSAETNGGTALLSDETSVLYNEANALNNFSNETTVLSSQGDRTEMPTASQPRLETFEIEYEITFTHTDEVIA